MRMWVKWNELTLFRVSICCTLYTTPKANKIKLVKVNIEDHRQDKQSGSRSRNVELWALAWHSTFVYVWKERISRETKYKKEKRKRRDSNDMHVSHRMYSSSKKTTLRWREYQYTHTNTYFCAYSFSLRNETKTSTVQLRSSGMYRFSFDYYLLAPIRISEETCFHVSISGSFLLLCLREKSKSEELRENSECIG